MSRWVLRAALSRAWRAGERLAPVAAALVHTALGPEELPARWRRRLRP